MLLQLDEHLRDPLCSAGVLGDGVAAEGQGVGDPLRDALERAVFG